jgi:hypothetical protein
MGPDTRSDNQLLSTPGMPILDFVIDPAANLPLPVIDPWSTSDATCPQVPCLTPLIPAGRWRLYGAPLAGVGSGVGRRQTQGSLFRAPGSDGLPVFGKRLSQQGMVGQG